MTVPLYHQDSYLKEAPATVLAITDAGGIVLDQPLFYPQGGGQPGDSGWLEWNSRHAIPIATTMRDADGHAVLVPMEPRPLPAPGDLVLQRLDLPRRLAHMRVHTALHLLSAVIPLPITGGAVSADRGRLDFMMPDPPADKQGLQDRLNALVKSDLPVTQDWIGHDELLSRPDLIRTRDVAPPRGDGRVRMVRIGPADAPVDLQPCGGTHVRRTGEIGPLWLGKIEAKGRDHRRVHLVLAD
ncbi:alanyl-tRNA editing protein [Actibacterium ureilyticum]|uniref:alanyl-tRNA editing protein n=1 Tax=Actibacterium ureilyticum TaxID=1590614 RepID=UPI000BAAEC77|nr:alanyl-tRNA editing protein [Actibacterium ureilyticum]